MSRGTNADLDQVVSSSIAAAAAEAGLQADPAFSDADLPAAAGPFVTMNVLDDDGTTIIACIAVRDSLSSSDELLERLANATATTVGASGGPAPAGPVGTGADLSLRFSMPVKTTALTDGREVQALIIAPIERRTGEVPGAEPAPDPGDARAAREAMATGGNTSGATLSALGGEAGLVGSLDKLVNVGLDVSVELGRTSVTLAEVLEYDVGSVIELDRAAGAPVDVRVNGMLLAQGEVVLIDDEYAVRITAIFDPQADR